MAPAAFSTLPETPCSRRQLKKGKIIEEEEGGHQLDVVRLLPPRQEFKDIKKQVFNILEVINPGCGSMAMQGT